VAMGGVTAEELQFGEPSTAAEDDIGRATEVAREMVGRHGMSAEVGRVRLLSVENGHLGGESSLDVASPEAMSEFDHEVKRLIKEAGDTAVAVLSRHRVDLQQLAARLEVDETLDGPVLEALLTPVRRGQAPRPVGPPLQEAPAFSRR
ncbi:MAG: cell division protein FtsH, partial [Actinobacteria bacterium]|nr:cell division protein FtsH [Actinomycetota bacterium]